MELYFIRHGQSQNNANWNDSNYRENPDPPLTDTGIEQARILADFLAEHQSITDEEAWNIQNRHGFGITHIYTSLMERAVQSAAPTARALGVPFAAWKEIHEGGGIFSRDDKMTGLPGKPRSYFEKNFPELHLPDDLDESGWWNRPFESEEERHPRAEKALSDLLARHGDRKGQPEQRVVFFSHGGFFVHFMCALLDLPWRQASNGFKSWFLLNNCSISRFDFHGDDLVIAYLNRTDHLPSRLITG